MTTLRELSQTLDTARVLVCAGTGGVGKTTIASALGIEAARRGRRVLVMTIDPARRLADALGISGIDSSPIEVPLREASGFAPGGGPGRLDALMLDPKSVFDRIVTEMTEADEARARILDNRYYQHLSQALAGNTEYAAMLLVDEYLETERYDLLIVDTPPSDHALDFLRAPHRLREFLEGRFVRALAAPTLSAGRFGARLFGRSVQATLGLIERIGGRGFIGDLSEFLAAIGGLSEGFLERASRVERVLLGEHANFVLVCGAMSRSGRSAFDFLDALEALEVNLAAVVVNRVPAWPFAESAESFRARAGPEARARDAVRLREVWADASGDDRSADLFACFDTAACARVAAERTIGALDARAAHHGTRCHAVPDHVGGLDHFDSLAEIGARLAAEPDAPDLQASGIAS